MKWQYKHTVATIFVIALFLDLMDTTILNVALPAIGSDFSVHPSRLEGVATAYLISMAISIPVSAWLGDRFGTKRSFLGGMSGFTLGSALCIFAQDPAALVVFRAVQGAGGGVLVPISVTMLLRAFPAEERGKAAAILAIPAAIAPAMGPIFGGTLVELLGWRWIFVVNLPICAATLIYSAVCLKEHIVDATKKVDLPGFALSACGLGCFLMSLALAEQGGTTSLKAVSLGIGGLLLLLWFVFQQVRAENPLLDLSLFGDRAFTVGVAVTVLAAVASSGTLFVLPMMLQKTLRWSALQSGLITAAHATGVLLIMPLVAYFYRPTGARFLLLMGMSFSALATYAVTLIGANTPETGLAALVLFAGIGFGLTIVPLQTATFSGVSMSEMGQASALFNTARQVALAIGVAVAAAAIRANIALPDSMTDHVTDYTPSLAPYRDALLISTAAAVTGFFVSWFAIDKTSTDSHTSNTG